MRQGDPLCPVLFILVMEGISNMLVKVVQNQRITGFSVGTGAAEVIKVAYLLFVNETRFFSGAERRNSYI